MPYFTVCLKSLPSAAVIFRKKKKIIIVRIKIKEYKNNVYCSHHEIVLIANRLFRTTNWKFLTIERCDIGDDANISSPSIGECTHMYNISCTAMFHLVKHLRKEKERGRGIERESQWVRSDRHQLNMCWLLNDPFILWLGIVQLFSRLPKIPSCVPFS